MNEYIKNKPTIVLGVIIDPINNRISDDGLPKLEIIWAGGEKGSIGLKIGGASNICNFRPSSLRKYAEIFNNLADALENGATE